MRYFSGLRASAVLVTLAELLLILISQFLYAQPFSMYALVNSFGIVGLLFMNIGLIIFIIQGGFFDGMVYSFRRFARAMRKKQLGEAETEAPMAEYKIRGGHRTAITWPLIFVSLLFFLLSIVLSFI